jgi:geranylgeranyl pyrophosphate synthase
LSPGFQQFLKHSQNRCERALEQLLPPVPDDSPLTQLYQASRYTLLDGGKRVRPILVYAAAEAVGNSASETSVDYAACAMEMLHVYSLVHDDLPAMDDDDLRRGKPSCHKAYNEATAILVGDGLQARAFELLAQAPDLSAEQRLAMVQQVAAAAGPQGMVGGQAIDIAATDHSLTLQQLKEMHSLKTGALIRAALSLGGIAAGASAVQRQALDTYGRDIGLAFQVVDDILDVEGETATLGKTSGKDSDANKPTYVKLLGLAGAREKSDKLLASSLQALSEFGDSAAHLRDLARYIVQRSS